MTARLCVLCGFSLQPTELQTCALCVSLVRLDLTQIEHCYALLPGLLGRPDGASLDSVMGGLSGEAALPGGDVLVMLGPGSATVGSEGDPSDPPAVALELATWCEDWATVRGETSWPVAVPDAVRWLGARLAWAGSHHRAWPYFVSDVVRIRVRLEAVTQTYDAPETGAPCIYCQSVNLERRFGDKGRADDWTCPRCRRVFDEVHYRLAVMQMHATGARNAG